MSELILKDDKIDHGKIGSVSEYATCLLSLLGDHFSRYDGICAWRELTRPMSRSEADT